MIASINLKKKSRLAVNSVTLGDYERPLQIGNFIKDLFSGFQLLNLKNDILRKRSDGIKYSVSRQFSIENLGSAMLTHIFIFRLRRSRMSSTTSHCETSFPRAVLPPKSVKDFTETKTKRTQGYLG